MAFVFLLMIASGIGLSILYARALQAEAQATREATISREVSDVMIDVFEVSRPSEARGNSVTARELLDKATEEIDELLVDQPQTGAELAARLGAVYKNLGLPTEAVALQERALETRRRVLGDDHPSTLYEIRTLPILYMAQGRYEVAEPLLFEALESHRRVLGGKHPGTSRVLYNLACVGAKRGDRGEALERLRDSLDAWHGIASESSLASDPDLESLRGDPEFEAILAEVEERAGTD
jgi:non-specific serine/threonine protein kinase/serine/threonine-protein kinase